jgi:hypothetical protein
VSCYKCDEEIAFLQLPVKSAHRKRFHSNNGGLREPYLARCRNCDTKVSAQHLIRRSLIESRPDDWPDLSKKPSFELPLSIRPLSEVELNIRYQDEEKCRVSLQEAKYYIQDRENKRLSLISTNVSNNNLISPTQNIRSLSQNTLSLYDEPSRAPANLKDNIIEQDDIFKYFSVMPPNFDDSRLTKEYKNFIISALAAVFQGHYWQHCPSCFKFSKRTNSGNSCRYCYPKERISSTKIEKKGILLERQLGHEYINSFNEIIIQTFRCNHDIQILIGGVEMSEVIFYCTKYTTKPQQDAYCSVALALASYRRRLEREKAASEFRCLSNEEVSRKRVTGLMHTMTNSIEIAGPLAALYLLRQSPAYKSHNFSSLRLDSILKWLFPDNTISNENEIEASLDIVKSFTFPKKSTKKKR